VDLTNEESTRRGLQAIRDLNGDRIASVIHLAAYYDFSGAPSLLYDKVTVGGTRRLLRLLQDFKVEQFIFSSTILVQAHPGMGCGLTRIRRLIFHPSGHIQSQRSKLRT
jgi:nucleoside-diphosphate-sugar epimerase